MKRVVTSDNLNGVMEFDHVIEVHADGTVTDRLDIYAPTLHDGELERGHDMPWQLMTGWSGQYLYNGPIMHPSEFIGGGMASAILASPGLYVALVDQPLDTEDEEPNGWAVAYIEKDDHGADTGGQDPAAV